MHENEVLVLLMGTGVLFFIVLFRKQLKKLPASPWLFACYIVAWVGWFATVLEHIVWSSGFNIIEHCSYAANGILLLFWCRYAMNGGPANGGAGNGRATQSEATNGRGSRHD